MKTDLSPHLWLSAPRLCSGFFIRIHPTYLKARTLMYCNDEAPQCQRTGKVRGRRIISYLVVVLLIATRGVFLDASAGEQPLSLVRVSAPSINCFYSRTC